MFFLFENKNIDKLRLLTEVRETVFSRKIIYISIYIDLFEIFF